MSHSLPRIMCSPDLPCHLKSSVTLRRLKHSRPGLVSNRSRACESFMAVGAGANGKEFPVSASPLALRASPNYIGMKLPELAARSSRLSTSLGNSMAGSRSKKFAVCVRNDGYRVSLETRKIYVVLDDPEAEKLRLMRVIDESGDDYL